MWPVDAPPAETYQRLLQLAKDDPRVLAFWLSGSRGMGRPTQWSDWDVGMIVDEAAYGVFCRELDLTPPFQAQWRPGIDLVVRTFPMLEAFAGWGTAEAGYRYMFAHLTALVDKAGRAQPLFEMKACVPPSEVGAFIAGSLDHALNQLYRAAKCRRDGDPDASRLEAAQAVAPFLDALFAVHDRRLRPYYKYLRWELTEHPLERTPFAPEELIGLLTAMVSPDAADALQRLMAETAPMFRAAGYSKTYDDWGEALDWMLTWRPA